MRAELLSLEEARRLVVEAAAPLETEDVPLSEAVGRALAEDVSAARDVPGFANSAMDGYAVTAGPAGRRLRIVDESRAGHPAARPVGGDEAIRISTGAMVPEGAGAVIPLERAEEADGFVELGVEAEAGRHIRLPGEDLRAGEIVLEAGRELGAAELALAAAAGRSAVRCARRPRVALVATGDELVPAGAPLGAGQIHNTNAVSLPLLARRAGAEVTDAGVAADRLEAVEAALREAAGADALCVSGGVSVGEHDHVKDALAGAGFEQRFWGVALKPGKPAWFGTAGARLAFGLPGNPVSAAVCFLLFVRPALRVMQGLQPFPVRLTARLAEPVARAGEREQAVRLALTVFDGEVSARLTGAQGSHLLSSMVGAQALGFVPAGEGEIAAGELIDVELI